MRRSPLPLGAWIAPCLAVLPAGCVQTTQITPPRAELFGSGGAEAVPEVDDGTPRAFVGLELEEMLLGSLDDVLEFADGLRVVAVRTGSPAERAGLRTGDTVLSARRLGPDPSGTSTPLSDLDQWSAVLAQISPGDRLGLEVERESGVRDVELEVAGRGEGSLPPPRRFRESRRGRFVAETVLGPDGRTRARIVEVLPLSPLTGAGLGPGTEVLALDEVALDGAADLARRVAAAAFGAEASLRVVDESGAERNVELDWWSPPRHVARFAVPVLFEYRDDPDRRTRHVDVLDLWLLSLFSYDREGESRSYRFLRFFHFSTGVGELTELPTERN